MIKNYISFFFLVFVLGLQAQEIKLFKVEDFDLKGKVESCLVITDYGKELFEFNEAGFLTKTVTQYNDTDQDITYYKYENGELLEKRMESYKDKVLDAATSMANFYTIDTVPFKKVSEKVISYDKEFLETQEYVYDDQNRLVKITTSNAEGVDETTLAYEAYQNELTVSVFMNGILEKSTRTSERKTANGMQKVVLRKEFIDGEPNEAVEEFFDTEGKLLSKEIYIQSPAKKEFVSERKMLYAYDSEGMLQKITTKTANALSIKEYIFQFDSSEERNWIKQIITPDNSYTSRKITYYPKETAEEGESN